MSSSPSIQGWRRYNGMDVTYFRPQKTGPESIIENTIANQIPNLFTNEPYALWAAGSPPIGAGMPDLVIVSREPRVSILAQVEIPTTQILAYLRVVRRARLDTIIKRVNMPKKNIIRYLNDLIEADVVSETKDKYSLLPIWREILPEIVTIEVKVTNWKRAIEQAARNRIFAHRSYIALPDLVAQRIRSEPVFRQFGIGLLSVSNNQTVSVLRHSSHRKPRVWRYYYEIAFLAAKHCKD